MNHRNDSIRYYSQAISELRARLQAGAYNIVASQDNIPSTYSALQTDRTHRMLQRATGVAFKLNLEG